MKLGKFRRLEFIQHEEVEETLERHEKELEQMARRLRRLEIEAGIFKTPLKGVSDNRRS